METSSSETKDIKQYVDGLMSSDKPISTLLHDLKAGKLKAEDVFAHYAAEYAPVLQRKVRAFADGNLFKAQRLTFTQWVSGEGREHDFKVWLDFQADLFMAGKKPKDVKGVAMFAYDRVLSPSLAELKRLAEAVNTPAFDAAMMRWHSRNMQEGWRWRQSD